MLELELNNTLQFMDKIWYRGLPVTSRKVKVIQLECRMNPMKIRYSNLRR